MASINVVVHGVLGKMGQQVLSTVCDEPDMRAIGAADLAGEAGQLDLPDGSGSVPVSSSLGDILGNAHVVVDFTNAEGAKDVLETAPTRNVNVVIGSTGLSDDLVAEAGSLAQEHGVGIIIAPNFAMGAVLMMHLAKQAARFFDYADLIEYHNEAKIDAPSGTALAIAKAVAEGKGESLTAPQPEKELIDGTRGGTLEGVSIHSGRMPGRVAHHELVFGHVGQTLTIRHDSVSRESFMPGVMMAIREAVETPGLTVGLDKIMGL